MSNKLVISIIGIIVLVAVGGIYFSMFYSGSSTEGMAYALFNSSVEGYFTGVDINASFVGTDGRLYDVMAVVSGVTSCVDSDGGLDSTVPGYVSFTHPEINDPTITNQVDDCWGFGLKEVACGKDIDVKSVINKKVLADMGFSATDFQNVVLLFNIKHAANIFDTGIALTSERRSAAAAKAAALYQGDCVRSFVSESVRAAKVFWVNGTQCTKEGGLWCVGDVSYTCSGGKLVNPVPCASDCVENFPVYSGSCGFSCFDSDKKCVDGISYDCFADGTLSNPVQCPNGCYNERDNTAMGLIPVPGTCKCYDSECEFGCNVSSGLCLPPPCTDGTLSCVDDSSYECIGGVLDLIEECSAGCNVSSGLCLPPPCTDGTLSCVDDSSYECIGGVLDFVETCPSGCDVSVGTCIPMQVEYPSGPSFATCPAKTLIPLPNININVTLLDLSGNYLAFSNASKKLSVFNLITNEELPTPFFFSTGYDNHFIDMRNPYLSFVTINVSYPYKHFCSTANQGKYFSNVSLYNFLTGNIVTYREDSITSTFETFYEDMSIDPSGGFFGHVKYYVRSGSYCYLKNTTVYDTLENDPLWAQLGAIMPITANTDGNYLAFGQNLVSFNKIYLMDISNKNVETLFSKSPNFKLKGGNLIYSNETGQIFLKNLDTNTNTLITTDFNNNWIMDMSDHFALFGNPYGTKIYSISQKKFLMSLSTARYEKFVDQNVVVWREASSGISSFYGCLIQE